MRLKCLCFFFIFTVQAAKKRWNALRDCYRKALNRKKTVSGQKAVNVAPWKYEEQMSFLKAHVHQKRLQASNLDITGTQDENADAGTSGKGASGDITAQDFEEEHDAELSNCDITLPDTPKTAAMATTPEKRKCTPTTSAHDILATYFANKNSGRDHLTAYFKMVEETVRTFFPIQQVEIKARINSLLSEYEYKNLSSAPSHHSSPSPNFSGYSSVHAPSPSPSSSVCGPTHFPSPSPSLSDHGFPQLPLVPQSPFGNNPSISPAPPESTQLNYTNL